MILYKIDSINTFNDFTLQNVYYEFINKLNINDFKCPFVIAMILYFGAIIKETTVSLILLAIMKYVLIMQRLKFNVLDVNISFHSSAVRLLVLIYISSCHNYYVG